ncbi:hypothetical protein BpHYR1_049220 [Brachionus plicatilis]|uniref:Uncharacterized protein n=1 Tax=Brachionus plicatilis TaxID=10195 RepID=A0A3M7RWX4_BRAPC|nr:hypothetical protein BpHYR1_049220 [Brachionus plicatilis]
MLASRPPFGGPRGLKIIPKKLREYKMRILKINEPNEIMTWTIAKRALKKGTVTALNPLVIRKLVKRIIVAFNGISLERFNLKNSNKVTSCKAI